MISVMRDLKEMETYKCSASRVNLVYNDGTDHSIKDDDRMSINSKIYIKLLRLTMALLIVDIFSRFDGHPGTIYSLLNYAGNFIMFLCSLFLPTLWVVYVSVQLFNDKKTIKKIVIERCLPALTGGISHGHRANPPVSVLASGDS